MAAVTARKNRKLSLFDDKLRRISRGKQFALYSFTEGSFMVAISHFFYLTAINDFNGSFLIRAISL